MNKKIEEIKKLSEKELKDLLVEERETVRALKFKDANRQLRNIREIRLHKKQIARILTILKNSKNDRTK